MIIHPTFALGTVWICSKFTALAEDQPYQKSPNKSEVVSILEIMGDNNHLDKNVIRLLVENYYEIVTRGMSKQAQVQEKYERVFAH